MKANLQQYRPTTERERPVPDIEMVELPLLLSAQQLTALECAARGQGLTIGQMLRRLINAFLHEPA